MEENNCILCKNSTRYISEKTDKMTVMLFCDLLGEFIDLKTATDPLAECDFYEYDTNDTNLCDGTSENGDQ